VRDILYMAWRYLGYNWIKTVILLFSITLIIYLPIGLKVVVEESSDSLSARAEATPLIIGAKGSPLELVLNTLYFESAMPAAIPYRESQRLGNYALATAIPLYARFRVGKHAIVGTTLDYFDFRGLAIAEGRQFAMLGECVVGATAARRLQVGPGDAVVSSPESVFDIAGVYPLKMRVVGVCAPTGTPDDEAVFVDIKTAWIIEGLAHGHQDLTKPEAAARVLKREGNRVVANASVVQYNEITADNADSFHFHGDVADFPVSAVIAFPHDRKSGTLLQGKYLGEDERVQVVTPRVVMDELLATILTVQSYVVAAVVVVGVSTLSTAVLVFLLSLRLRRREIVTLHKIGGSKRRVIAILASEIVLVISAGILLAGGLTLLTARYGACAINAILLH
jgi:putative ABC transport system permease protein